MSSFHFFAPCPRGLEPSLADELKEISINVPFKVGQSVPGGVHFSGGWETAFATNLHSRIASRVLLKMDERAYRNEKEVFEFALEQSWEQWFSAKQTLRVDVTAVKSPLKSLEFITLKIKDAICDRLRDKTGARPDIDTADPDIRVSAFFTATHCTLYLDTSGDPLFKRGWRLDKGAAPLRENLAAGILRIAKWTPEKPLYDPMCGSGTFLIEAAQIALGIAPGSSRKFGFEKMKRYDITRWQAMKVAAVDKRRSVINQKNNLPIFGSDISGNMLSKAAFNCERAGIPLLTLKQIDARGMSPPINEPGILVMNPPYGERIELRGSRESPENNSAENTRPRFSASRSTNNTSQINANEFKRASPDDVDAAFFNALGNVLKKQFSDWQAYILSSDRSLPGQLRLRESAKTPLFNGALDCRLFRFNLVKGSLKP